MYCEDCACDVEVLVHGPDDPLDWTEPESAVHVREGHDLSSYSI
jgi:hypothetical protein